MRVVFCGSGEFATPSLRACRDAGHDIAIVATQPARHAGRGGQLRPTPVAVAGAELGLNVVECPDINDPAMIERLREAAADAMIVADFGQMVRLEARKSVRIDAFNLHGSLLPDLRGAAPINWAIIKGYETTGVTTFSLVDRMDAGDVYLRLSTQIAQRETAGELKARLAQLGAQAVLQTLDMLAGNPPAVPTPQDDSLATKAPGLKKCDGVIDWNLPAATIRNLVHGTWPWPGARTLFVSGERRIEVTLARCDASGGHGDDAPAGQLRDDLSVQTGEGRLTVLEIKPAGKRLMEWRDFANGYRVRQGDRFVSLEQA